jgi:hypothetical protein
MRITPNHSSHGEDAPKMALLKRGKGAMLARVGISAALAVGAVGGLATSSQAAVLAVTPSATSGPAAGGNTITLTLASTATPKFISAANVGVQFQNVATLAAESTTACSTTAGTPAANIINVVTTRFLSSTKISALVPDLSGGTTGFWVACVYNNSTLASATAVLAKTGYSVALPSATPTFLPLSGPSVGGQTIIVTGTNFPTTIATATPLTATLGGVAMTGITAISATSFSAVTPPGAAGTATLTVTTLGGTVSASAGTYTYKNGIVISPNTVPSGSSVDVDVQGEGFSALTFNATDSAGVSSGNGTAAGTNSVNPHVYLVAGATYNSALYAAGVNKTNGQKAECVNPVVIGDDELICTLNATNSVDSTTSAGTYTWSGTDLADGVYTMTVVDGGSVTVPTFKTIISSGAAFTVGPF